MDCLNSVESSHNAETLAKLKRLIDIKPKVVQDITAIIDRFPCQFKVAIYLNNFVVSESVMCIY